MSAFFVYCIVCIHFEQFNLAASDVNRLRFFIAYSLTNSNQNKKYFDNLKVFYLPLF